jgi:hypothetical protein
MMITHVDSTQFLLINWGLCVAYYKSAFQIYSALPSPTRLAPVAHLAALI